MQDMFPSSENHKEVLIPDGKIDYYPRFLDQSKADRMLSLLRDVLLWREDDIKMFGKTYKIPRLQAWYGDEGAHYKYSGIDLPLNPWHDLLLEIKASIEKQTGFSFNSVLANWYRDGQDSNGWHADNEKELGLNPVIASITLGTERIFQMKHRVDKDQKRKILLEHGSLLIMRGKTQHFWLHQIAKSKKIDTDRINLTFRNVVTKQK